MAAPAKKVLYGLPEKAPAHKNQNKLGELCVNAQCTDADNCPKGLHAKDPNVQKTLVAMGAALKAEDKKQSFTVCTIPGCEESAGNPCRFLHLSDETKKQIGMRAIPINPLRVCVCELPNCPFLHTKDASAKAEIARILQECKASKCKPRHTLCTNPACKVSGAVPGTCTYLHVSPEIDAAFRGSAASAASVVSGAVASPGDASDASVVSDAGDASD